VYSLSIFLPFDLFRIFARSVSRTLDLPAVNDATMKTKTKIWLDKFLVILSNKLNDLAPNHTENVVIDSN
jgi:hypothetical protein